MGGSNAHVAGEAEVGDLLDLIYDAALDPELWPRVVEGVSDALGGWGGSLTEQNQLDASGEGVFVRADAGVSTSYFSYSAQDHPLLHTADPDAFVREWRPRVLTDEDLIPKEELVQSPYYNELLRRVDIHSILIFRFALRGTVATNMSIGRPLRREQFGAHEIALASRLQPHLMRAIELGRRAAAKRGLAEDVTRFLDRSPDGFILLDEQLAIRQMNLAAERLIARRDGLRVFAGRLCGATQEATNRLAALVARARAPNPRHRSGGSMALPSPSGRPPLSVTVAPARPGRLAFFDTGPLVIVCVADLEATVRSPGDHLAELFGLSPAEARVALALFEGLTLREAADASGVSFNTVRTHLARIFDKTGVNRQSELVRLMLRSSGPLSEEPRVSLVQP
ncbi:MAG: helix-turn-helix transcriptional regulator [Caulobacteraceae bacterium]